MAAESKIARWRVWLCIFFAVLAATLIILKTNIPQDASEEYIYTIQVIFKIAILPAILLTFLFLPLPSGISRYRWLFLVLGCLFFAVPLYAPLSGNLSLLAENIGWRWSYVYSACWMCGFFCIAAFLFFMAARFGNIMAGIFCLFASLLLCLGIGEGMMLFSSQGLNDGYKRDTENSRYVLADEAQAKQPLVDTPYGKFLKKPEHPSASYAQRDLYFDKVMYDVRYTLNDRGHRITPSAAEHPYADVLTFGCSYTFGYGLENDQTWPWNLAVDLGPQWRVENYASNAFGAQQMLDLLEHGSIAPPTAPHRYALYLGIDHHLIRQTGLFEYNSSAYALEDGKLVRKGLTDDLPVAVIHKLPRLFNGSQLIRMFTGVYVKSMELRNRDQYAAVFVAMLKKSADILQNEYGTRLTILIWPDLEFIEPLLDKAAIPWLELKPLLKDWDQSGGAAYHILANVERHPNAAADRELAAGLASWLKKQATDAQAR